MKSIGLKNIFEFAVNRIYWIIIPFLVVILGGFFYIFNAPRVYESETLVLIQPPEADEDNFSAVTTVESEERQRIINNQVTDPTILEEIIKEYQLFDSLLPEQKIKAMRESIISKVGDKLNGSGESENTFKIKFRYNDPVKVMKVTNALASNLTAANIVFEKPQAPSTSTLSDDELDDKKKSLAEIEERLKKYQSKYMGRLPENLDANLAVLNNLQMQLARCNNNINSFENRKLLIQQQASISKENALTADKPVVSDNDDLAKLRSRLSDLEKRYTPNHPDVRRVKEEIARIEKSQAGTKNIQASQSNSSSTDNTAGNTAAQLKQIESEIDNLKKEKSKLEKKINTYELIIKETPKKGQELDSLKRDYENAKESYELLLNEKPDSDTAVNKDVRQKTLQFKIIEPAKIPVWPVKPKVQKSMSMVSIIALALGLMLAFIIEIMDTSFKNPEQLEEELELPVLASVGFLYSKSEIKKRNLRSIFSVTAIVFGFIISASAIIYFSDGMSIIKSIFNGIAKNWT